tara:strand:- start:88 stop:459 length:372 start_codon:yes stop_codon:yes gene_type:complete
VWRIGKRYEVDGHSDAARDIDPHIQLWLALQPPISMLTFLGMERAPCLIQEQSGATWPQGVPMQAPLTLVHEEWVGRFEFLTKARTYEEEAARAGHLSENVKKCLPPRKRRARARKEHIILQQ